MQVQASPFSRQTITFLSGLANHNDRDWFEARRSVYERALRGPMLQFIDSVSEEILSVLPEYVRAADRLMMRIYRDTRFSADKTPYKTHIAAWWGHNSLRRTSGAGFYFHLSAQRCVTAAGVFMADRDQLLAIRTELLDTHTAFAGQIAQLAQAGLLPHESRSLSRTPKGFPADHAAASLLRRRQWGCTMQTAAREALQPGYAAEVGRRFLLTANLVELLNRPLLRRSTSLHAVPE